MRSVAYAATGGLAIIGVTLNGVAVRGIRVRITLILLRRHKTSDALDARRQGCRLGDSAAALPQRLQRLNDVLHVLSEHARLA